MGRKNKILQQKIKSKSNLFFEALTNKVYPNQPAFKAVSHFLKMKTKALLNRKTKLCFPSRNFVCETLIHLNERNFGAKGVPMAESAARRVGVGFAMLERLLSDVPYVQALRLDQSDGRRHPLAGAAQRTGKEPACSLMANSKY